MHTDFHRSCNITTINFSLQFSYLYQDRPYYLPFPKHVNSQCIIVVLKIKKNTIYPSRQSQDVSHDLISLLITLLKSHQICFIYVSLTHKFVSAKMNFCIIPPCNSHNQKCNKLALQRLATITSTIGRNQGTSKAQRSWL